MSPVLVTTIPDTLRHPLSRASPFQAYSLYPALGWLGRVCGTTVGEGGKGVYDSFIVVGDGVAGSLLLAKDTEHIG